MKYAKIMPAFDPAHRYLGPVAYEAHEELLDYAQRRTGLAIRVALELIGLGYEPHGNLINYIQHYHE